MKRMVSPAFTSASQITFSRAKLKGMHGRLSLRLRPLLVLNGLKSESHAFIYPRTFVRVSLVGWDAEFFYARLQCYPEYAIIGGIVVDEKIEENLICC